MRLSSLLFLVALGTFAERALAQTASPAPFAPGKEVSLSRSEVKDTFFAWVLGIIKAGVEVDIDNAQMRDLLTEFKTSLALPFDLIARVTQRTEAGGARRIGLDFTRNVRIPIPFALLFYHPGSIVASQRVGFKVTPASFTGSGGSAAATVLACTLSEGSILVDIDGWLEVLLRAFVEDTWVNHLVFFTWRGDWMGLLAGTGRRTERPIRAYFNFTRNSIIFPVPSALDQAGRRFVPPSS